MLNLQLDKFTYTSSGSSKISSLRRISVSFAFSATSLANLYLFANHYFLHTFASYSQ